MDDLDPNPVMLVKEIDRALVDQMVDIHCQQLDTPLSVERNLKSRLTPLLMIKIIEQRMLPKRQRFADLVQISASARAVAQMEAIFRQKNGKVSAEEIQEAVRAIQSLTPQELQQELLHIQATMPVGMYYGGAGGTTSAPPPGKAASEENGVWGAADAGGRKTTTSSAFDQLRNIGSMSEMAAETADGHKNEYSGSTAYAKHELDQHSFITGDLDHALEHQQNEQEGGGSAGNMTNGSAGGGGPGSGTGGGGGAGTASSSHAGQMSELAKAYDLKNRLLKQAMEGEVADEQKVELLQQQLNALSELMRTQDEIHAVMARETPDAIAAVGTMLTEAPEGRMLVSTPNMNPQRMDVSDRLLGTVAAGDFVEKSPGGTQHHHHHIYHYYRDGADSGAGDYVEAADLVESRVLGGAKEQSGAVVGGGGSSRTTGNGGGGNGGGGTFNFYPSGRAERGATSSSSSRASGRGHYPQSSGGGILQQQTAHERRMDNLYKSFGRALNAGSSGPAPVATSSSPPPSRDHHIGAAMSVGLTPPRISMAHPETGMPTTVADLSSSASSFGLGSSMSSPYRAGLHPPPNVEHELFKFYPENCSSATSVSSSKITSVAALATAIIDKPFGSKAGTPFRKSSSGKSTPKLRVRQVHPEGASRFNKTVKLVDDPEILLTPLDSARSRSSAVRYSIGSSDVARLAATSSRVARKLDGEFLVPGRRGGHKPFLYNPESGRDSEDDDDSRGGGVRFAPAAKQVGFGGGRDTDEEDDEEPTPKFRKTALPPKSAMRAIMFEEEDDDPASPPLSVPMKLGSSTAPGGGATSSSSAPGGGAASSGAATMGPRGEALLDMLSPHHQRFLNEVIFPDENLLPEKDEDDLAKSRLSYADIYGTQQATDEDRDMFERSEQILNNPQSLALLLIQAKELATFGHRKRTFTETVVERLRLMKGILYEYESRDQVSVKNMHKFQALMNNLKMDLIMLTAQPGHAETNEQFSTLQAKVRRALQRSAVHTATIEARQLKEAEDKRSLARKRARILGYELKARESQLKYLQSEGATKKLREIHQSAKSATGANSLDTEYLQEKLVTISDILGSFSRLARHAADSQ